MKEASFEETPFGRYVTSEGWFVLNLGDALAVRNEEKGGATYPLESRDAPFRDVGVRVTVLPTGEPNALYHSEDAQEGFLVLSGACTLIVEEEERPASPVGLLPLPGRDSPCPRRRRRRPVRDPHARRPARPRGHPLPRQ